jgi:hypothetical protein
MLNSFIADKMVKIAMQSNRQYLPEFSDSEGGIAVRRVLDFWEFRDCSGR